MQEFQTTQQLCSTRCVPCEGGVPRMSMDEIQKQLGATPGWEFAAQPDRIRKSWVVRNFSAGMNFFREVERVAEAEGHHPDLHLVGFRNITIEIWTHAIQGLSINDFILAARIDQLPIELRTATR